MTEVVKGDREDIRVTSLRAAFANTQHAVVVLPRYLAQKLKDVNTVKIGWIMCRVEAMKIEKRCYRSWGGWSYGLEMRGGRSHRAMF